MGYVSSMFGSRVHSIGSPLITLRNLSFELAFLVGGLHCLSSALKEILPVEVE